MERMPYERAEIEIVPVEDGIVTSSDKDIDLPDVEI